MKWFHDMKISAKLLGSFGIVAFIASIIGYVGITNINSINNADTTLYTHMTVPIGVLNKTAVSFQKIRVAYRDAILARNPAEREKYATALRDAEQSLEAANTEFEKTISTQAMRDAFKEFQATHQAFIVTEERIVALARENKHAEAIALLRSEGAIASANAQQQALDKLVGLKIERAKEVSEANTAMAGTAL